MNNSRFQPPSIHLLWLTAASLQVVVLIGTYLIMQHVRHPSQPLLVEVAYTAGKFIVVAVAGLLLFLWRKRLIRLLRHNAHLWIVSRNGPLIGVFVLGLLVYSAHQTHPQLYLGQSLAQSIWANAWQALALVSVITVLSLATVRNKYRLMLGHPSHSLLHTAATATGVTIVAVGLAPGIEILTFSLSLPLIVLIAALFLGSRFPRDFAIFGGTTMALLSIVAIFSSYRRYQLFGRFIDAYSGAPNIIWKTLFVPVTEALRSAEPIGSSAVFVLVHESLGQLFLAGQLPFIGYLPAMLVATLVVTLSVWLWVICFNAPVRRTAYGRQVLRYIGLASAGLLVINMTQSLLANFAVMGVPFPFGMPFLSSRFANAALSCIALTAASLMPRHRNPTPNSGTRWTVGMIVASALLLAVCARGVWSARHPFSDVGSVAAGSSLTTTTTDTADSNLASR